MNTHKEHAIKDWLSSLPDSILIEILSKLKATELIQTCVLSKRWLELWTFVPCLDFSDYKFKREETSENKRFENFVSSVLRNRDDSTDLQTFRIYHSKYDTKTRISATVASTWIRYALKHNPKKLEIVLCMGDDDVIQVPDYLFTCESLEYLDMDFETWGDKMIIKPDKVWLPRLRNLYLGYATFNSDYMEQLLIGCPVLESLGLSDCALEMNNISFRNLKDLSIISCYFVSDLPSIYRISAPGLRYLYFKGDTGTGVKLEDMCTVTKAEITVIYDETDEYDFELLSSLSGVENLKIDSFLIEITLEGELPKCPTFHNLKNLTIAAGCMYCHFGLLLSFLNHCPNLEFLTLSHEHEYDEYDHIHDEWRQNQEPIERFGCSHLQKINILYSKSDVHVDKLMRLLLQSTSEIEDLQIISSK